jgi:lanosterol synthase
LSLFERFHLTSFRKRALANVLQHIRVEDSSTHHIDIGPVNKAINMMCIYHAEGNQSPAFKAHEDRLYDYLWLGGDGMRMQGYNGSQLWDTAFSLQALIDSGITLILIK